MRNIYIIIFVGLLCPLLGISQSADLILNSSESGQQVHLGTNSITFNAGYSYTPDGSSMVARIVKPEVDGSISYPSAINPSTYAINTLLDVGSPTGGLNVGGSANYSVALNSPKGANGLQPSISLNYTSTFRDGLLGIGWDIGGLSTITRVNETFYHDSKSDPVRGDLTDKYAMDGNRLLFISGSSYGADNSEYRTEMEGFSKIMAYGSTGEGPEWFKVYTKSGLICEYGNSNDSKVEKTDGCVLTWKLNKISDRYNNYITFSYIDSDDEHPIGMISYTGNNSLSKTPASQIIFNYKNRSDVSNYYYGGKKFDRALLLDNIEMVNNGQTFKYYELEYMRDTYAQLQKVTEYSSQGKEINPTVFAWTDQTEQFTQGTHYSNSSDEYYFIGDFNGDGRDDLVTTPIKSSYTSSDKWKLYLANSSGNMVYETEGSLNYYFETFIVGDFNGDGMVDLLMQQKDLSSTIRKLYYLYQSTGSTFNRSSSYYSCNNVDPDNGNRIDIVDYNGDGILEIMYRTSSNNWYLYTYSGSLITSGSIPDFGTYYVVDNGMQTRILDFNGDGCSDVLTLFNNGYKVYEFKGTSNKLTETYSGSNIDNSDVLLFGDYNGDSNIDIIRRVSPYTYTDCYLLSLADNGFESTELDDFDSFNINVLNNRVYARDMNADGKTDIVFVGRGTSTGNSYNRINIAISNGEDFNTISEYTSSTTMQNGDDRYFNFGDFNGDGRYQLFYKYYSASKLYSFANGTPSHLISNIIDGFGTKTGLTYLPMSNSSVYTKGSGASYPLVDFSSSAQLVSQVQTDDGIGGTMEVNYSYAGAKVHRKGKSFLGFSQLVVSNTDTGISNESNYLFDGTYYYPQLSTIYTKEGSTTLTTTMNTWSEKTYGSNRIFPYISTSTHTDNQASLSVETTSVYDTYGNPTSVEKDYGGDHTQTVTYNYTDERISDWLIGRPTTITETSVKGGDTDVFTTTRSYFTTNNSPNIDLNNSGDASYWKLDRDYDGRGNLWKEHRETTGLSKQTTIYEYDLGNDGKLLKVTDPTGTETEFSYYSRTGLLKTETDDFGNVTTYNYSDADQLSSVAPTAGITSTITSGLSTSGGPSHCRYYIQESGSDGSLRKTWYDKLGRELRKESKALDGSMVKVDKQYNYKGQLYRVSEPSSGTPSSWNTISYYTDGRINTEDPFYGATTTYSYSGATASRTVNGRSYNATVNSAQLVTDRTDPGGSITYAYRPNGLVKSTTVPDGEETSMTYDKNGNRLTISDPSAGTITNTYYGTGQVKTTKNNDNETTTYYYQSNGLLDYYTSPEGTTNYSYNTDQLVSSISSPGGVSRSYTYDSNGRVYTITESIGGVSNTITFNYDSKSRLYRKYFNGSDYEEYVYNSYGYLYQIKFNGTTVWQMTDMDDYGHLTQATIGSTSCDWNYDSNNMLSQINASGVQRYDYSFNVNTGNLNSRINYLKSKTESFGYDTDNLDRLASVTGPVNQTLSYTTDKNGNIYTKSDAGTYAYDDTPYAVSSISNAQNISTTPQSIDYYSFEKVEKITEGTKTADFEYNADHHRIRMVLKDNGVTTKTRWYFGSNCEREQVGSTVTQYIWIGGNAYSAVAVAKKVGTGSWTVYNIFRDHLGTITHLKTGSTVSEYSFDAWGRRRDKDSWSYTLSSEPALFAGRGFTAHEHLEDFALINMNGRLYDPVVGRFLSPDPYVQMPDFTQSFNRYSYCLNNPLKYYDPTGEKWRWKWLNPLYWFGELIQTINDNTEGLREKMTDAGIPNFGVGINSAGNTFHQIGSYRVDHAQARADRATESNVNAIITKVRKEHGQAWWEASYGGSITVPYIFGGMENSTQALLHYFNGNGTPVTLGNNTINAMVLSDGFQTRHQRIISGKTTALSGSFSVNLTSSVFHVGRTNVDYSISCANGNCTVTYDLFVRDGFWDPDFVDEYFMGRLFGNPLFQPDGLGPNLERFGGTPYPYNPVRGTYKFPNPGY